MGSIDAVVDCGIKISEDLVPQPLPQASDILSLPFTGLLHPPLLLQTNQAECGGQLWPAGMVLADYLLRDKKEELRAKTMFVGPELFPAGAETG